MTKEQFDQMIELLASVQNLPVTEPEKEQILPAVLPVHHHVSRGPTDLRDDWPHAELSPSNLSAV